MKQLFRIRKFAVTNLILILASVLSIVLFIYLSFFRTLPSHFICEGNVTMSVDYENVNASVDAAVQFIPRDKHEGVLKITGTLSRGGSTTDIHRTYAVWFNNIDKFNYEVKVKNEIIHQADGVADDFFYHDFFPEKIGELFMVSVTKVNANSVLVEGLAYPYFICVLERNLS